MIKVDGKNCSKCGEWKYSIFFALSKDKKDGLSSWCKKCHNNYVKENRDNYRESLRRADKKYYYSHRYSCLYKSKKWKDENREKVNAVQRGYVLRNKEKVCAANKAMRNKSREKARAYARDYYQKNKSNFSPTLVLSRRIARLIRHSLGGHKEGKKWQDAVGYTAEELKKHLERQFLIGMDWDNYGEWHIDHKVPVSVFNFKNTKNPDFKRCWALKNLQPLWAKDNIVKGAKLSKHFQPWLALETK